MNFILPVELGNAILAYLVQKPFAEVANLIIELQKLAPEEAPKKK